MSNRTKENFCPSLGGRGFLTRLGPQVGAGGRGAGAWSEGAGAWTGSLGGRGPAALKAYGAGAWGGELERMFG